MCCGVHNAVFSSFVFFATCCSVTLYVVFCFSSLSIIALYSAICCSTAESFSERASLYPIFAIESMRLPCASLRPCRAFLASSAVSLSV